MASYFLFMQKSHLHEKCAHKQCLAITGWTVFLKGIYIPNCIWKHKKYDGSFLSQIGRFCISATRPF